MSWWLEGCKDVIGFAAVTFIGLAFIGVIALPVFILVWALLEVL